MVIGPMPKQPTSKKDRASEFLSAALRHVTDADRLLATSPDQSWHLAGFGPECARKACLDHDWWDRVLGHDLTDFVGPVLEIALALDVRAARYDLSSLTTRYPVLAQWDPNCRYDETGTRDQKVARPLVDAALDLTARVAAELWMDGHVEIRS